jgi:hypothetical protein
MKLRSAIAVFALATGVAGCAVAPTSTSTSTTTSQETKVDAMVKVIQNKYPAASRVKAIDLAEKACTAIDQSGSIADTIALIVSDDSIDVDMAGDMSWIIGVSVPVLCPEYLPELNRITG